jgi:uncharacterized damage-inducible protein DinB
MKARIRSYIEQFSQVFNGKPWLDETFCKKLDPLSEQQVFTQAPGNNHSVAEVVSHIIVWRNEILRRLVDNSSERMLTDESADNWKPLQELRQTGWQQLYTDFKQLQEELINLLESRDDNFLAEQLADTEWNKEYFVAGLLHHDIYHLGQIGLILKWAK